MIEWKLFWTGLVTAVSGGLIAVTMVGVLLPIIPVLLAGLITAGVVVIGPNVVEAAFGGDKWMRRRIWLGLVATAVTYTAWITTGVLVPVTWQYVISIAAAGVILPVIVYWGARGVEWRLAQVPAPRSVQPPAEDTSLLGHRERILRAALRRAGIKWARVLPGTTELRDDAGCQFKVRVVSTSTLKKDDKSGAQADLTPKMMEALAIALTEITGREIDSDWVRLRKERGAGLYSITITNRDVMAEVIPFVDDPTPASITDPALMGIEIDGREHYERLDQHTRDVGGSTAGKSSLIHLALAHATRCDDAIIWIGGVQKLYDLVAPWLEPYHNKGLRPPIDWVANGVDDTLKMMAAAMSVARWRQRQPMHQRKWRKIIVILDEFSFTVDAKGETAFDGDRVTASWLASAILRGAASGDVFARFASQRSTADHYGDRGTDVIANIQVNNGFRSKDFAEVGRLTGDYKLPPPRHQGEYYTFTDLDPKHLKAPYIQSTDPSKKRLHDGATIADVSWARRHMVQGGLTETEGLAAAGQAYLDRHELVTDEMFAYLTGSEIESSVDAPINEAHGEVYDTVRAELARIAEAAGLDLADNDPAPEPATPPTTQEDTAARPANIIAALERLGGDHPNGLTAAQIAEELNLLGDTTAEPGVVGSTLNRMARNNEIERPGRGRYLALTNQTVDQTANQTNDQTNA